MWKTQVSSFPKAATYREFKNRVKFESYLSDIRNRKYRVTCTKFRLSDYCLMIEKGRHKHPKIPREQRLCPFCPTKVEDESHFLMQCILYENRNELFMAAETEAPNFTNLNTQEQFIFLMSQENRILNYKIISTIHEWFTKRLVYSENLILSSINQLKSFLK